MARCSIAFYPGCKRSGVDLLNRLKPFTPHERLMLNRRNWDAYSPGRHAINDLSFLR